MEEDVTRWLAVVVYAQNSNYAREIDLAHTNSTVEVFFPPWLPPFGEHKELIRTNSRMTCFLPRTALLFVSYSG